MKFPPMYQGRILRPHEWQYIVDRLREGQEAQQRNGGWRWMEFDPGLSDDEIRASEIRFQLRFPPDLRMFLQLVVPRGDDFPNWRADDDADVRRLLDWPRQSILYDIGNGVWHPHWGSKPTSIGKACARMNALLDEAPRLIPIHAHRVIPMEPFWHGNPVFSVYQTDIVTFGHDLIDYFEREWGLPNECAPHRRRPRYIPFWTAMTRVELPQPHDLMGTICNGRLVKPAIR